MPPIADRPDDDSLKRFVLMLVAHARAAATRRVPGEPDRYLPGRDERHAREALMPATVFLGLATYGDDELAAIFGVPLEQFVAQLASG